MIVFPERSIYLITLDHFSLSELLQPLEQDLLFLLDLSAALIQLNQDGDLSTVWSSKKIIRNRNKLWF